MIEIILILFILFVSELLYFRIADHYNIIDKPNERSSHSSVVLRGGGIIFLLGIWLWSLMYGMQYPWFLIAVTLVAGISFVDDIMSLPDSLRLVCQFAAMALIFYQIDLLHLNLWWAVIIAFIVFVGATNIINFMDGINGITAAYALAVLVPLMIINNDGLQVSGFRLQDSGAGWFVDGSLLNVVLLSIIVFSIFNFRPKGMAKCFAGDVGSVGIAFILLFVIGKLIMATGDVTYLIFLLVYGVDGCMTIAHRIQLHENLGQAHRKHAFQLMANELGMSHITVSLIYMGVQLAISLGFIYVCPNSVVAHWIYLVVMLVVLIVGYVVFMKKYYHLHEAYLASLK